MYTSRTQFLSEIAAGHDGPMIPASTRTYFQERFRGRVFDFLLGIFLREKAKGLTQAKLARRIGKSPEVINRWLGSPTNLTLDSISDLLIGIAGDELVPQSRSVLERADESHRSLDYKLKEYETVLREEKEKSMAFMCPDCGHEWDREMTIAQDVEAAVRRYIASERPDLSFRDAIDYLLREQLRGLGVLEVGERNGSGNVRS